MAEKIRWKVRGIEMESHYEVPDGLAYFFMTEARAAMIIKIDQFIQSSEDANGLVSL